MGLKKYEIITVGSDKRVRALRSWAVGDRYVNIGDVGGIVYDEKTLSQDGACWLFRGNFNFPGARIGGDSIVDVGEAAPDASGSANLDILGTSTVVGAPVKFTVGLGEVNGLAFSAADFEQGTLSFVQGANWETWKSASPNYLRTKAPIFMGGVAATLKLDVPGYTVQAYVLDRDGIGLTATAPTNTGGGVTLSVPAGQYMVIRLAKTPAAGIVPADATAAQIKTTAVFDTKLVVVDSRLEVNPANGTGVIAIRSGGLYSLAPGAKYPDSIIQGSKVVINSHTSTARVVRMLTELVNVSATIDATTADAQAVGVYHGVYNLEFTGPITSNWNEAARSLIQAYDCDNMVVNTTNFPGLAAMQTAGVPIRFYNCNLNNGRFYHHAQIANTYRDINFDLATAGLGKPIGGDIGKILVSSEVNGMYRGYGISLGIFGPLIESAASVERSVLTIGGDSHATTIYADAYLNGAFDFRGANVFGNTVKREASNTQDISGILIKGLYNATTNGTTISGVVANNDRAVVLRPFRISGGDGVSVDAPAGVECNIYLTDSENKILSNTGYVPGVNAPVLLARTAIYAYVAVRKTDGSDILSLDEVKGVTVTTHNGCRIINTKATAAVIAGNVRVEDNATLIDVSVTGTGYFGGNSIIQAPSDLVGQLPIEGAAYMSDNAVFAPSVVNASAGLSLLEMKDNAVFAGQLTGAGTNYIITMADNAQFLGTHGSRNGFNMRDNSFVAAAGTVVSACRGLLTMKDDARIENGSLATIGHITLCGKYKQTATKTWTGKRVIASQDAPKYDNNVKTKYDI